MEKIFQLRSARLLLRQWQPDDYPHFASLNADAEVMRYFPGTLTEADSDELAARIKSFIEKQGWGFWALQCLESGEFIGFTGLASNTDTPRGEILEIGWRLRRAAWGKGYATEAGSAALLFAFEMLKVAEVYAFTPVQNDKSRAVMNRLNMTDTGDNFMHPRVAAESSLQEHVLYRLTAHEFEATAPVEIICLQPAAAD